MLPILAVECLAQANPTIPYPNPFDPSIHSTMTVEWSLAVSQHVRVTVVDLLGRPVALLLDAELSVGTHRVGWNGRDQHGVQVANGIYLFYWQGLSETGAHKIAVLRGAGQSRTDADGFSVSTDAADFAPLDTIRSLSVNTPVSIPTTMLGIPAGSFTMGSEDYADEEPVHEVYLNNYFIDRNEISVSQYRECVEAGICLEPAQGEACNWGRSGVEDHPVNCISWNDAARYCGWTGKRLPTEAEWEKAARGTDQRRYPWGNGPPWSSRDTGCSRAIMMWAGLGFGCGYDGTAPTGTLPGGASPYGVMDMAGNVWEWVADWYDADYYAQSPIFAPHNDSSGEYKVLRGNSWYYVDPLPDLRAANRYRFKPLRWVPYVGARCARSALVESESHTFVPVVPFEHWAMGFTDWRARNRMARFAEGDTLPAATEPSVDMVRVPAGPFVMGANGVEMDAAPPHRVYLTSYYIDQREVTVAEYQACVKKGVCTRPYSGPRAYRLGFEERYTNWGKADRAHHPVNAVTWYQAEVYCNWAGKRLPTEAEWEKAARGFEERQYPWGDTEPDCSRIAMDDGGDGCGQESTWPVGSFPDGASPYGAVDMAGNVWEWVADWYEYGYYSRSPPINPQNNDPERPRYKVLRGGSFADQNVRIHETTNRLAYNPAMQYDYTVGFRCARDASR